MRRSCATNEMIKYNIGRFEYYYSHIYDRTLGLFVPQQELSAIFTAYLLIYNTAFWRFGCNSRSTVT